MPPLNTEGTPLAALTRYTGLDEQTFIDLFGAAWTDADGRGSGSLGPNSTTRAPGDDIADVSAFLFGTPAQLAFKVGVTATSTVITLGTPDFAWHGHIRILRMANEIPIAVPIDPEELRPRVASLLEVRRGTFGFCRYCGSLRAPEDGIPTCHGCMSRRLGVVF
ncbi:hypothetical protein ACWEOI_31040 [Nocardia sp. NPDC004340]